MKDIDPLTLWAHQYHQQNPAQGLDPKYGQDEWDKVSGLLPPRLMAQVQAGKMTLQGALGRYMQFLRGQGAGATPQEGA